MSEKTKTVLLTVVLALYSLKAFAHVFPIRADPRVGSTVKVSPSQVSILFDGEMEPVFSKIHVENKDRVQVDQKNSHVDSKNPYQLIVDLHPKLQAGEYRVEWAAVARDGHTTTGRFSFEVKP